jgi:hypothetical protein
MTYATVAFDERCIGQRMAASAFIVGVRDLRVPSAVLLAIQVFWNVTLCRQVRSPKFRSFVVPPLPNRDVWSL